MASLNISFTDQEMEALRVAAAREGVALKPFVHAAAVEAASARKARVAELANSIAQKSAELNRRLA
ncbi:antitoxin Phd [Williamsia sp. 1135]|uniref:antitoxin Phd n=1 Tax=Williamsia sp. 1135 TaxID=1889262 RepID=UPI000A11D27F|nr:antitoxin Phd [Williamsia sp. 1135]ORM30190.1 antitoxin Phd [Williamsia sp. 1135]